MKTMLRIIIIIMAGLIALYQPEGRGTQLLVFATVALGGITILAMIEAWFESREPVQEVMPWWVLRDRDEEAAWEAWERQLRADRRRREAEREMREFDRKMRRMIEQEETDRIMRELDRQAQKKS